MENKEQPRNMKNMKAAATNPAKGCIGKQQKLDEIRKEIDGTGDALGMEIDKGIKETVVFLNALGVNTSQSCEGHKGKNSGFPWPWIQIDAPGEPQEKYKGQVKLFEQMAEKKGLDPKDYWARPAGLPKSWFEKWERLHILWNKGIALSAKNSKPTGEYTEWTAGNRRLYEKTSNLLEEFYEEHSPDFPENRLALDKFEDGGFRISFQEDISKKLSLKIIRDEMSGKERERQNKKLPARKTEMAAFAKFLEKKYWE